jgi:hypothetical protein
LSLSTIAHAVARTSSDATRVLRRLYFPIADCAVL